MRLTTASKPRPLSRLKNILVRPGKRTLKIRTGIFKNLTMELDLTNQMQFYVGLHERELYPWVVDFSRGIRTAIDVGAGEGEYSLYFGKKTSAERIYIFEPD